MKRKALSAVALTLCALVAVFAFTACGNSSSSSKTSSETSSKADTAATEATTEAATEAAKAALVGKWDSQDAEGTSITFKENGTGVLAGTGYAMNFTYVDNGDSVDLTLNETETQNSKYTIEGDILSMEDTETGTVLTYKKGDDTETTEAASATPQPDSALLGTWESDEDGSSFTFSEDGNGSYTLNSAEYKFTFVDNGSSLELNFAAMGPQSSTYTIDGDKLSITDSGNTTKVFTKK